MYWPVKLLATLEGPGVSSLVVTATFARAWGRLIEVQCTWSQSVEPAEPVHHIPGSVEVKDSL